MLIPVLALKELQVIVLVGQVLEKSLVLYCWPMTDETQGVSACISKSGLVCMLCMMLTVGCVADTDVAVSVFIKS